MESQNIKHGISNLFKSFGCFKVNLYYKTDRSAQLQAEIVSYMTEFSY